MRIKCGQNCRYNNPYVGCLKPQEEICPMANTARKEEPKVTAVPLKGDAL